MKDAFGVERVSKVGPIVGNPFSAARITRGGNQLRTSMRLNATKKQAVSRMRKPASLQDRKNPFWKLRSKA